MDADFKLRLLTPSDFDLLTNWHARPHIIKIYNEKRSAEKVAARYSAKMDETDLEMYIFYYGKRPIGYIQAYNAFGNKNGWWPDEPEGTWGIDLFIGEEDCLNKGLGPILIRQFSEGLLARPEITRVIADPAPSNIRSRKAFEKAGFQNLGPIVTPDGDAILMEKR